MTAIRGFRVGPGITLAAWLYLAGALSIWLTIRVLGENWWLCTMVLFGPRWLCTLPLGVLLPAALWMRRGAVWPLALAALVVIGPLMGFCVPWGRGGEDVVPVLRILTCNLKGRCQDNQTLEQLIHAMAPDVVSLQGCWSVVKIAWPEGWNVCQAGPLLVASRFPLEADASLTVEDPGYRSPTVVLHSCRVRSPEREFHVVSVHLPSPHRGISDVVDRKTLIRPTRRKLLEQEIAFRQRASAEACEFVASIPGPVLLAGDFNLPVDSGIYRSVWSDRSNAFTAAGFGFGYTEWPYIRGRWFGVRIDHILLDQHWSARRCWVGPDVGSDHLPLWADVDLR